MKGQELQWNYKRQQSEPLRKLYCRHFHDILSEFCLNGVSMDRCQLLWLLGSGKVVGYKEKIPDPDPLILKEEEVLGNKGCRSNLSYKISERPIAGILIN